MPKKTRAVYGYHIASEGKDGKPVTRDGRPVVVGERLSHEGKVEICQSGYHASKTPFDAASYSPTTGEPWLCIVKLEEVVTRRDDKLVARHRTVLKMAKATQMFIDCANAAAKLAQEWSVAAKPPIKGSAEKTVRKLFQDGADQLLGTIAQAR
jgi:hypothetical protein